MAQSGYTPILIYASGTASNVPSAANLTSSASGAELALNYADGKLYFKNSSGVVTLLASSAGASGDVVGPASATDNALARFDLTTGKLIQNSVGILSDAGVLTGLTGLTSSGNITLSALTSGRVPYASTGGLLVDSANLLFDGTTLTANALTTTSTVTINGGTANGVAYLNGSKVLTTGSALTFDGTNLSSTRSVATAYSGTNSATWANGIVLTNNATPSSGVASLIQFAGTGNVNSVFGVAQGSVGYGDFVWASYTGSFSEQMRLTSTGLGIGESSPTVKLDITGNDRLIRLNATSNNALMRYSLSGTAKFSQGLNDPVGWILFDDVASAYRLVVDYSGNLGIGTSSPFTRLESAAARATTLNSIASFNTMAASVTDTTPFAVGVGGGINFRAQLTSSSYNTYASIWSFRESANTSDYKGSLIFGTSDNGDGYPEERMRLDSSGNLGLGVTPSAWATFGSIFQGIGYALAGFSSGSNVQSALFCNSFFNGSNHIYRTTAAASEYLQISGQHQWFTAPSGTAGNAITFTQAMTLDASGNLGIGTSSPSGIFNIKTSNGQFLVQNGTSANQMRISAFNNAGNANAALIFEGYTSEYGRFDSSGNLGLGVTPSAWPGQAANYDVFQFGTGAVYNVADAATEVAFNQYIDSGGVRRYITSNNALRYRIGTTEHQWFNAASGAANDPITFTQAMTLDASGNLVTGGTSANVGVWNKAITLNTASGNAAYELTVAGTAKGFFAADASNVYLQSSGAIPLIFTTNGSERARITSGGYSKFSNDGTYVSAAGSYHEFRSNEATNFCVDIGSTSASFTAGGVVLIRANRNTTNNTFYALSYYNDAAGAFKFRVADSGDVTNTNGTYGTISDAKMKADIVDAGSQWADIKALRFRKFKMKDDPSGLVQLGVVAQEVELTSPGLVDEHQDRDAEGNDLGTTTKSVKTSVLLMKAAVALQEAMSRIEALEAQVAQLKGA